MQSLTDICRGYEVDVELLQTYHARASYFGDPIFDFFPKKCRFNNLQEKDFNKSWHTLSQANWKDDIHRILSTFLWTKKIYPTKKDSDLHGGVWEDVKNETKDRYALKGEKLEKQQEISKQAGYHDRYSWLK